MSARDGGRIQLQAWTQVAERWTEVCGNPQCRTRWLQLWRSRSAPRLEGAWACSAACMDAIAALELRRCISDWEEGTARRGLLMPLGLVLLSRGWITRDELNGALAAQRRDGQWRIGEWLNRLSGVPESTIAKALGAQWNCTALTGDGSGLELVDAMVPWALLQRYQLLLLRHRGSSRLYLVGQGRAPHAAVQALEHMLEQPVEAAFLEDRVWLRLHQAAFGSEFFEAGPSISTPEGAAAYIARCIEQSRPEQARMVRLHDHLWLRMWHRPRKRKRMREQVEDVIIPLRAQAEIVRAG